MNYSDLPQGFAAINSFSDLPDGFSVEEGVSEAEANRTLTTDEQAKAAQGKRTWGEAFSEGISDTQNAIDTGKAFLWGLTPVPAFQRFNRIVSDPKGESDRTRKHYADFFNEEGLKEKVATNFYGTAAEVSGMAPPMRAARATPKGPIPMPRASVREGPELLKTGGSRRNEAKKSDYAVPPEEVRSTLGGFHDRLAEKAMRIDKNLHPKSAAAFSEFVGLIRGKPADPMSGITHTAATPPEPATLQRLHEIRQRAQEAADDVHPGTRRPTADAAIGMELKKTIDEVIAKHPEGVEFARGTNEIARGLRDREIADAIDSAMQTATWNRGDHATAIRNALRPLYKKYRHIWPKEDLAILKKAQKFGFLTDTMAGFASKGPGAMTFSRIAETSMLLPPFTLYPVAAAAKHVRNKRIEKLVNQLREQIRAGGPVE